ncbi:MAG: RDD family protein [Candidatus Omnitrophota bacterium]
MEPKYATFWPRFFAGFIDFLVLMPISFIQDYIIRSHQTIGIVSWLIVSMLMYYVYDIYFHAKFGQTLGKMVMKVKLMDISETRIVSFKQALLRESVPLALTIMLLPYEIMKVLNGTSYLFHPVHPDKVPTDIITQILMYVELGWVILEVVTMAFNSKRRAVHDFIAGSVVVRV